MNGSIKRQPALTDSHQRLTQVPFLGFKTQLTASIQNYLFLYNIFLIIASVIHIRTRVIYFYFSKPVDKSWFVYYSYPIFPNVILTWGV